jgi:hypothetical protein
MSRNPWYQSPETRRNRRRSRGVFVTFDDNPWGGRPTLTKWAYFPTTSAASTFLGHRNNIVAEELRRSERDGGGLAQVDGVTFVTPWLLFKTRNGIRGAEQVLRYWFPKWFEELKGDAAPTPQPEVKNEVRTGSAEQGGEPVRAARTSPQVLVPGPEYQI